jgi:hypothetical protein
LEDVSNYEQDLYCYGDADSAIVCVPRSEVWVCETMPNGDEKCVHTPDGQEGWTCTAANDDIVCTKSVPNLVGGAGWDCVSDDVSTTCTSVSGTASFSPPAEGSYVCAASTGGVVCTGSAATTPPSSGGSPPGEQPPGGGSDMPKPGEFRSQTPGGWGAPAAGNNAGAYRDANFAGAFPNGLTIGCSGGKTALFTDAKAIENFLPAGGTPGVLVQNYVNPFATSAGVLAGHTVAMTLAVGFDGYDPNFGSSTMNVKNLVAQSGACMGMTVQQILGLANAVVGGCSTQLSPSAITSCVDAFNNNFVDGVKANGYLGYP